ANTAIGTKSDWSNIDVEKLGADYRAAIGNYNVEQLRKAKTGRNVSPEERVQNQLLGYRALQYKMMDAFANGNDVQAKQLGTIVNDYQKKVLDSNPEFRKNQVKRALGAKIY